MKVSAAEPVWVSGASGGGPCDKLEHELISQ